MIKNNLTRGRTLYIYVLTVRMQLTVCWSVSDYCLVSARAGSIYLPTTNRMYCTKVGRKQTYQQEQAIKQACRRVGLERLSIRLPPQQEEGSHTQSMPWKKRKPAGLLPKSKMQTCMLQPCFDHGASTLLMSRSTTELQERKRQPSENP